jgi:hypothetical protein
VSMASGPWASDSRCCELPALPIESCRAGAGTGVPTHLLGPNPRWRGFGAAGVAVFLAPSPNNAPTPFWEAFWGHQWRCSKVIFNGLT